MVYDLHGTWDGFTGNNAPLYPSSQDVTETSKQLNVVCKNYESIEIAIVS